jgi:hypothetical protein
MLRGEILKKEQEKKPEIATSLKEHREQIRKERGEKETK